MLNQNHYRIFSFIFILATVLLLNCTPPSQKESDTEIKTTTEVNTPKIVHHVFFWLKRPGNEEDKKQLIEGLNTLRQIGVIKNLLIGTAAPTEQRDVVDSSYDVSELMFFNNTADQKTYQDHPIHAAFVEKYGHLWEKVIVYDMQTL